MGAADVSPDAYLNPITRLRVARRLCDVAPRLTSRTQPTPYHRDAGRERLGRLTGWIAAGGIAGVGIFSVVAATSAPRRRCRHDHRPHAVDRRRGRGAGDRAPDRSPRHVAHGDRERSGVRRGDGHGTAQAGAPGAGPTAGDHGPPSPPGRRGHDGRVMSPPVAASAARASRRSAPPPSSSLRRRPWRSPPRRWRPRSRTSTSPAAGSVTTAGSRR